MKDLRGINQYAVGILLFGLSMLANNGGQVQAAFTMNETCKWLGVGYIGDPSDCQKWGYCEANVLKGGGTCNPGLLYDMERGTCRTATMVQCRTSTVNICSNILESRLVGDPNNCKRFCTCVDGKTSTCYTCPGTQVFDASSASCIYASASGFQCPADSICRLVPNNKFVGDPTPGLCGNYLRCNSGTGNSVQCQAGYQFSPSAGGCMQGYSACTGNNPAPGSGLPPAISTTACKAFTGTPTTNFFAADGLTCYGFYSCADNKATTVGYWSKCPFATHFDETTQKCNNPNQVVCQQDRCGNLNLKFVDNLQCKTYRYCVNGVVNPASGGASQTCPDNYPFFNEMRGGCTTASAATSAWPICTTNFKTLA